MPSSTAPARRFRPRCLHAATIALTLALSGCLVGPHQVRRSVDDWDQRSYVNSPWWNVVLWVVPIIPASYAAALVVDTLVTDPYAFWFDDAWDGNGTGFRHLQVDWTDGHMDSLLLDRAMWTRIQSDRTPSGG